MHTQGKAREWNSNNPQKCEGEGRGPGEPVVFDRLEVDTLIVACSMEVVEEYGDRESRGGARVTAGIAKLVVASVCFDLWSHPEGPWLSICHLQVADDSGNREVNEKRIEESFPLAEEQNKETPGTDFFAATKVGVERYEVHLAGRDFWLKLLNATGRVGVIDCGFSIEKFCNNDDSKCNKRDEHIAKIEWCGRQHSLDVEAILVFELKHGDATYANCFSILLVTGDLERRAADGNFFDVSHISNY